MHESLNVYHYITKIINLPNPLPAVRVSVLFQDYKLKSVTMDTIVRTNSGPV